MAAATDGADLLRRFLEGFRELEAYLAKISGLKDDYVSFSRSLNAVNGSGKSPIVSQGDNYAFLKAASDLRNLVVHNNGVCYPTRAFVDRFVSLAAKIEYPTTCLAIATTGKDLVTARFGTPVRTLAGLMVAKGLSHVPVLADGSIVGVFSTTTLFDSYRAAGRLAIGDDTTVADFRDQIGVGDHSGEAFLFATPGAYVYEFAARMAKKSKSHEPRIAALFITDNGRANGRLLGVVTPSDFLKIPLALD